MIPTQARDQKDKIKQFLGTIGILPDDIQDEALMLRCFIHKSYASDFKQDIEQNERLEFLGDSVLGMVIASNLYNDRTDFEESYLTLYKIALVREETLAEVARDIGLGQVIFVSHGEDVSGGRDKDSILSDALEALIGYIYLDIGLVAATAFINKYIYIKVDKIQDINIKSYKTMLQEKTQKLTKTVPEYKDKIHKQDKKDNITTYKTDVYLQGKKIGTGYGRNKKTSQEEAAQDAFENFNL